MPSKKAQQELVGGVGNGSFVAASNQTLNAWMGGRQPSWMTSQYPQSAAASCRDSATVTTNNTGESNRIRRNSSRSQRTLSHIAPDSARLTHGNTSAPLARPTDAIRENPVVAPELGKQTPDSAAALPSPAPTDQPSPPLATSNHLQDQNRDSGVPNPSQGSNHLLDQPNVTSADQGVISIQGPAIIGHSRQSSSNVGGSVSAESGQVSASDQYTASGFALTEEDILAVQAALDIASSPLSAATSSRQPSHQSVDISQRPPGPAASIPESKPDRGYNSTPITAQNAPVSSTAVQSPVAQLATSPQGTAVLAPNQGNGDIQQTTAVAQTVAAFSFDYLHRDVMSRKLNHIIEHCGDAARLPADNTTGPRLKLLKDAVELGDYFYLALHQILCVWSFRRSWVLHHLNKDPLVIQSAMKMVQNILRKNEHMPESAVALFANFPESPQSGLWTFEPYQKQIRDVATFLQCLHEQWNCILVPSMKPQTGRGYPILSAELHYQLRLRSPVLEPVLFTVTRRHLGIPDGPIADQLLQLFLSDVKHDYNRMSEEDQSNLRATLIIRYKQLVLESRGILSSATTSTSPQARPNPPMVMPQALAQQQLIEHTKRFSAGYSPTQQTNQSPNVNASVEGLSMYPSPVTQNSFVSVPPQYRLRSNNLEVCNGGRQISVRQPMTRAPIIGGYLNQPLTPAGSPLHANMQLPIMGRMVSSRGQSSPALQTPPAGLAVSMPTITSPTQSTASPGVPNCGSVGQFGFLPNNGSQGQPSYSVQQAHHQQALQALQMRQVGQVFNQRPDHTTLRSPSLNTASPRHQMANVPPAQGYPHQIQTSLPHGQVLSAPSPTLSEVRSRASVTQPMPRYDGSVRPPGALFRPPHHQISIDHIPHSPYCRKAFMMSLHQVDVRSPRRVPRELPLKGEEPARHYQSIKSLALGPVPTQPRYELHRLEFSVSEEYFDKISTNRLPIGEQIPVSQYFNGSLRYRLRLCELPLSLTGPTVPESTWAVTPTYWPDHISIMVNNQVMKIRRKQHNGQHLPVELTSYLVCGMNTISVGITPQPCVKKKPPMTYFMAVEVIETLDHQSIFNMVTQQGVIPADATMKSIQNRLKVQEPNGDDDLAVVDDDLSINMADPFSSIIFEIPVRGAQCTHMECFDLVTWLNTRPAKEICTFHDEGKHRPACCGSYLGPEPSFVDKWKCPLCDGDARPYSLRMDKFMVDIRTKLEADGQLRTKIIYVAADGSWRPKIEEECDDGDEDMEDKGPAAKRVKMEMSRPGTPVIELIELD